MPPPPRFQQEQQQQRNHNGRRINHNNNNNNHRGPVVKRSRILWEEASRSRSSKLSELQNLAKAIMYELQPIRYSEFKKYKSTTTENVVPAIKQLSFYMIHTFPKTAFSIMCNMTKNQWMMVMGVLFYYLIVRWIHQLLHAGPIVLIVTALVGIFTIGLGDNDGNDGSLSAYSVFNRGYQRLMGDVDMESLLAQHVGGGLGGGGLGMMQQPQPQPQQMQHDDDDDDFVARPPARNRQQEEDLVENNDDNDDDANNNDNNNNRAGGSRKSGKKARRRNLEERRDQRRQRDAALEMGLDGTEGPEEMMAMQRLIEDQIFAAENNNNDD